jgi:hypothetical protein
MAEEFSMISKVDLTIEKNGRTYVFSMPVGAPFGEAYDVAFGVLNEILELSKKAAENAKPKETEKEVSEVTEK